MGSLPQLLTKLINTLTPSSRSLSQPEFCNYPGVWFQTDASGKKWGFIGLKLELPEEPERVLQFLPEISCAPIVAFKIGLKSRAIPAQHFVTPSSPEQAESTSIFALQRARADWLKQQPLRQRQGFLVLQVDTAAFQTEPSQALTDMLSRIQNFARLKDILATPMVLADHALFDLDSLAVPEVRPVDVIIHTQASPTPFALHEALQEFDQDFQGTYLAVLTGATSLLTAGQAFDRIRTHCMIRLLPSPQPLTYVAQRLQSLLRKRGLFAMPRLWVYPPQWPTPRQASQWQEMHYSALTPLVTAGRRLVGTPLSKEGPLAAGVPLVSPAGELRTFDPFEGQQGHNTYIAGFAGAGRHTLAKEMLLQHLSQGEDHAAYVVDDGCHYHKMADALKGVVVPVDGKHNGIDLLRAVRSSKDLEDNLDLIRDWLEMLAGPSSDYMKHLWSIALAEVWSMSSQPCLKDFVLCLSQLDNPQAKEAALAFEPYLSTAEYEGYFEHSLTLPDQAFVVLDLCEIHKLPYPSQRIIAQSAQAFVALNWQQNCGKDLRKKLMLIDYPAYTTSPKLLLNIMRRCRMLNGGVLLLGGLSDVISYRNLAEVVPAIDHWMVLQSPPEDALQFEQQYFRTGTLFSKIAMLKTQRGKGAEVLVISNGAVSQFVFNIDRLAQALYSSSPSE